MKSYLICLLALGINAGISQAKTADAAEAVELHIPVASAHGDPAAQMTDSQTVDRGVMFVDVHTDSDRAQPIGSGTKASGNVSIEDYVMVPVENLEHQLRQPNRKSHNPTGTLKGKYPTLYAGAGPASGASFGDASFASDGGDGDSMDDEGRDEEEEEIIEEDGSEDDNGNNGSSPEEINL